MAGRFEASQPLIRAMPIASVTTAAGSDEKSLFTSAAQVSCPGGAVIRGARYVLGMRVDATSYGEATDLIVRWAQRGESRTVIEVPVNAVMESYDHPDFQKVINRADLVTPGGMPIVWTLRLLGVKGQPRVYGPELTLHVCAAAARLRIPVGFYGGSEQALALMQKRLVEQYPGLTIVYACSPPFRLLSPAEEEKVAAEIRQSGCRILFVGLGCPKQERWMERHRDILPAVMLGVGAAFDFISGQKRQAFPWMQAMGLEWLFRWATEPRRLFFRYAYHNPRFVVLTAVQLLRQRVFGISQPGHPAPGVAEGVSETASSAPEALDVKTLAEALRQKRRQLILKRLFDFGAASLGLLLLAPALLLIALLIRCGSPGPIIFRQARVGRHGKPFVMFKFRTMRAQVGSAEAQAQAAAASAGILVKGKDDARVTSIGRFLRSTSLDELPQLFNVLKGDMSFVGPRPLLAFMLAGHPEFAAARALVRPGITGLWQIHERENNTSARVMMPYDLEYISQFNLRSDFAILIRTPFVVVGGHGAF